MINKYKTLVIFTLFCFFFGEAYTQSNKGTKNTKIKIIHADIAKPGIDKGSPSRLIGHVVLLHNTIRISCDSLHQFAQGNKVEAYGNVHIIQNDTLNLWGDMVKYDGDSEIANAYGNVKLKDKTIVLTTDALDYETEKRIAYYNTGGTIVDKVNVLKSQLGHYYSFTNTAYFKQNVTVTNPNYIMYSDTLTYNTTSKFIQIIGPTRIVGENRTLYSENGWYNTISSHAELYKNNKLTYDNFKAKADTITIDSITKIANLHQNIEIRDTINNIIIVGEKARILKNNELGYVTKKAMLTLVGKSDSIFIHSDTLSICKDSSQNNIMKAYYDVKIYSKELQGRCDSISYPIADSTIYMRYNPILWASGNQMTATDIDFYLVDNKINRFKLLEQSMIVNPIDSTRYRITDTTLFNQIKGRIITGYIKDNNLYKIYVDGNGETIYYPDEKGIPYGLTHVVSANIRIDLKNKKIDKISFLSKPEGTMNPIFMVKKSDKLLAHFYWHKDKKILKKSDIFKNDISINKIDSLIQNNADSLINKKPDTISPKDKVNDDKKRMPPLRRAN